MSLVLCDNGMFVEALASALAARDHRVLATCEEPERLVDLVSAFHPDAVVLDVGCELPPLAAAIRREAPGTAVVLLSAQVTPAGWDAYDARLVDGLVSKSHDIDALDRALSTILDGERLVAGFNRPRAAGPRRPPGPEPLTAREREVLRLIVDGIATEAMADRLGVSANTVRTHVQSVLRKLRVHHRSRAAYLAVQLGLVQPSHSG
jgi:DNA-binding NarL/FixJ family response regulator